MIRHELRVTNRIQWEICWWKKWVQVWISFKWNSLIVSDQRDKWFCFLLGFNFAWYQRTLTLHISSYHIMPMTYTAPNISTYIFLFHPIFMLICFRPETHVSSTPSMTLDTWFSQRNWLKLFQRIVYLLRPNGVELESSNLEAGNIMRYTGKSVKRFVT